MSIKLDLNKFKYHSSDDDTTTLEHESGHKLTVVDKAMGKEARAQLQALKQAYSGNHSGQNPAQMAVGGRPEGPEQFEMNKLAQGGTIPSVDTDCMMAKGGKPRSKDALASGEAGQSEQGRAVRLGDNKYAKQEAKGRAEYEREFVKPDLKGMAEGGQVERNPKLEQSKKTPPEHTLDYTNFGKETNQKNRTIQREERSKPRKYAEGGEAYPPCMNPNCSSHGQSHPNCKCYQGMAKGGEIKSICDVRGMHEEGCEYAKGGEVRKMYADPEEPVASNDSAPTNSSSQDYPLSPGHLVYGLGKLLQPIVAPQAGTPQGNAEYEQKLKHFAGIKDEAAQQPQASPNDVEQSQPAGWSVSQTPAERTAQDQTAAQQQASTPTGAPADTNQTTNSTNTDTTTSPTTTTPKAPQTPPPPPENDAMKIASNMIGEKTAYHQDLIDGHITPKTYSDLFHYSGKDADGHPVERSTLGKIGMIFGLMASGMGSGLAHQSNAFLDMMNNEIKNDIDAQVKSKDNARNFYHMVQQDLYNRAGIKLSGAQKALIDQQAAAQARMLAQVSAYDKQAKAVDVMPEGLAKQQAVQALTLMQNGMDASNTNIAGRYAAYHAMVTSGGGGGNGIPSSMLAVSGPVGEKMAQARDNYTIPGIKGQSNNVIDKNTKDEIVGYQAFDTASKRLKDFLATHKDEILSRTFKQSRDKLLAQTLAQAVQQQFRSGTLGGIYKKGEQPLLDAAVNSDPLNFMDYFLQNEPAKLDQLRKSNKDSFDIAIQHAGLPPQSIPTTIKDEPQIKTVNGIKYKRGPNGEAIRVK